MRGSAWLFCSLAVLTAVSSTASGSLTMDSAASSSLTMDSAASGSLTMDVALRVVSIGFTVPDSSGFEVSGDLSAGCVSGAGRGGSCGAASMSLSGAASWETPGGASRVLARDVLGHCPCCSDRVLAAVAVAAAVLVLVVALAVAVVAVAVAVSSSCMAAERASTLSAAESMAVCVERGGGGVVIWLSGVAGCRRTFLRQFPPPHPI